MISFRRKATEDFSYLNQIELIQLCYSSSSFSARGGSRSRESGKFKLVRVVPIRWDWFISNTIRGIAKSDQARMVTA